MRTAEIAGLVFGLVFMAVCGLLAYFDKRDNGIGMALIMSGMASLFGLAVTLSLSRTMLASWPNWALHMPTVLAIVLIAIGTATSVWRRFRRQTHN